MQAEFYASFRIRKNTNFDEIWYQLGKAMTPCFTDILKVANPI